MFHFVQLDLGSQRVQALQQGTGLGPMIGRFKKRDRRGAGDRNDDRHDQGIRDRQFGLSAPEVTDHVTKRRHRRQGHGGRQM